MSADDFGVTAISYKPWTGLRTKDTRQNTSYLGDAATEAAFWFGT